MMRSIVAQHEMDPGVNSDGVITARLDLPGDVSPDDRRPGALLPAARRFHGVGVRADRGDCQPRSVLGGMPRQLWREDEIAGPPTGAPAPRR